MTDAYDLLVTLIHSSFELLLAAASAISHSKKTPGRQVRKDSRFLPKLNELVILVCEDILHILRN